MNEDEIKDTQYITIMGWMRNIPEIENNNELMAYALIYGFSQTEGQYLTCNQSYIAKWLKVTRQTCNELLAELERKGLIQKILVSQFGAIKKYKYSYVHPEERVNKIACQESRHGVSKKPTRACQKSRHALAALRSGNNIRYDYNNNIYNNIRARAREEVNKMTGDFDHKYDFEQLELQLLKSSQKDGD